MAEVLTAVTCTIGPQQYALPLGTVLEVVRIPAILTVAGTPRFMAGMINLRGRYLPVLDGRAMLNEPEDYDLSSQIIVLGEADHPEEPCCGLLVDRVGGVETFQAEQLATLGQRAATFLQAVVSADNGAVTVLNPAELRELART